MTGNELKFDKIYRIWVFQSVFWKIFKKSGVLKLIMVFHRPVLKQAFLCVKLISLGVTGCSFFQDKINRSVSTLLLQRIIQGFSHSNSHRNYLSQEMHYSGVML